MKKMLFKTAIILCSLVLLTNAANAEKFDSKLQKYAEGVVNEYGQISEPRKGALHKIVAQIVADLKKYHEVQPLFICTHNSRRKFDDKENPKKNFFAVMVCSEADAACPLVTGADNRISLPYDDPRHFDGTPSVEVKYDETCRLIAREMFYVMSEVKKQLPPESETKKK